MKLKIFTIFDRIASQYGTPMFMVNAGQATRSFADQINSSEANNMFAQHSDDFDLYAIGEWDTETGEFNAHSPQQIAVGKNLRTKA